MTAYVKRASVPPHLVDDGDPPAIALLKEDHQVLRALFDLVETVGDDVLFPVAGDICIRLAIHMAVEEHLLYPALKPVIGVREIDEGIVEHQVTKRLISDIMEMTGREEIFRARVHVLGEETVHHIDEEDRVLFPHARKAWEEGKVDLVELGTEMSTHRRELFDRAGSAASDTHTIDLKLVGETIEELPQSGKLNGVAAAVPVEEEV
jgi:iron-sulfur cluster repair protein YtfE (RIC family)